MMGEISELTRRRIQRALNWGIGSLPIVGAMGLLLSCSPSTASQGEVRLRPQPAVAAPVEAKPAQEQRAFRSIKGRIVFVGEIPKLAPLVAPGGDQADNAICTKNGPIPDESLLIDSKTRGIANVFVYFDRRPEGAPMTEVAAKTISIKTEGCRIHPRASMGRTGDEFEYSFVGPALHNLRHSPAKNPTSSQNPVLNGSYSVRSRRDQNRQQEIWLSLDATLGWSAEKQGLLATM